MLQNYFFLNRLIVEANKLLIGSKIIEIFSQEKSKLIIFLSDRKEQYYLEICVIPGSSFIHIRNNYSRARKNTINFFEDAAGEKINGIFIADDDRILKLHFEHSDIFFAIRGKFTNVFHFKDNKKTEESFKSVDDELLKQFRKEFNSKTYINNFNKPDLNAEIKGVFAEAIRKKYPFIGNEIIKEIKARNSNPEYYRETLTEVLSDIETKKPAVFIDENSGEVNLGFETFKSFPFTRKEIFDDLISAQNFFFSKEHFISLKQEKLTLIRKHLEKEFNRLSGKINKLHAIIDKGSKEDEYNKFGNLLLINLSSIKSGMKEIEVDDIYGKGKIKIELNPASSPKQNVDYYFSKSKSEKTGFAKSQELLQKAKAEFANLKEVEKRTDNAETIEELNSIMKELKIKVPSLQAGKSGKEDLRSKFKHYIIENKYHVFAGKDSQNNDLLTTKFAKQNDYWFHARGAAGSHVVLRVENTKQAVPKNILKKAAALAAYHSKAKTSGLVPVAYTFKKYVVKKKSDPAGTVHLLREDVLIVKPEIPDGCEYVNS